MEVMRIFLVGYLLSMLGACTTNEELTPTPATSSYASSTATVVVGNLKGVFDENTKLSWHADDLIDLSDATYLSPEQQLDVENGVKRFIEQAFERKGIPFSTEQGSTRYQVVVAGAGSNTKVEKLHELFKVYPGLGHKNVTHGALMIAVVDTARNFALWRGVVEGEVAPEISMEARLQRLQMIVDTLVKSAET
ncbi:hypothetical protein SAMN02745866_02648 [Alteromonadaceae bacterium Bs31]|nr:hypothetical protein SAMN02745866_02648 [Alteromonadaceae bacterium Bs31]